MRISELTSIKHRNQSVTILVPVKNSKPQPCHISREVFDDLVALDVFIFCSIQGYRPVYFISIPGVSPALKRIPLARWVCGAYGEEDLRDMAVHHLDPRDNRLESLKVLSETAHKSLHWCGASNPRWAGAV